MDRKKLMQERTLNRFCHMVYLTKFMVLHLLYCLIQWTCVHPDLTSLRLHGFQLTIYIIRTDIHSVIISQLELWQHWPYTSVASRLQCYYAEGSCSNHSASSLSWSDPPPAAAQDPFIHMQACSSASTLHAWVTHAKSTDFES